VQGTRDGKCVGIAQSGGGQAKRAALTPCGEAEGYSNDEPHLANSNKLCHVKYSMADGCSKPAGFWSELLLFCDLSHM